MSMFNLWIIFVVIVLIVVYFVIEVFINLNYK